MRLATFNVENLFERPAVMNLPTWEEGRPILEDFDRLNHLISRAVYSDTDKAEMLEIIARHPGLASQGESRYLRLRAIRGKFLKRTVGRVLSIAAQGRRDWVGWFELKRAPVQETALENTARIISAVNADILCVIEVEDRVTLKRFNAAMLPLVGGRPYDHVMVVDGNDERGIDVGILTRHDFPIRALRSHVDDRDSRGTIFSRDCAEYQIITSDGQNLLLLVNHFKSKGFGSAAASSAKRRRQASRVREIYQERLQNQDTLIAIVGDLNDTPDSNALVPLMQDPSLTDVMAHSRFSGDGRPGTFANGTKAEKLDYILMSPPLAEKVTHGGIERRGVWGGKNGTLFPHLPEIRSAGDAASDHAALWVDIVLP